MKFETYLVRKMGEKLAKFIDIGARKRLSYSKKSKEIVIEIDEKRMISVMLGEDKYTISALTYSITEEDSSEVEKELRNVQYEAFINKMCKLFGNYEVVERESQKLLVWKR